MSTEKLSDCFNANFKLLKIFSTWPGKYGEATIYYKLYSFIYLFVTFIIYNVLLTLNLIYTPLQVDLWIKEVIFYFTEFAAAAKACMILFMRAEIVEALDILDGEFFNDEDDTSKGIVKDYTSKYRILWRALQILSNFCYLFQIIFPYVLHVIFPSRITELPICKYYFLSDETVSRHFEFLYFYQSIGIYGHMQYNICCDTLVAGFLIMAIIQVKILNCKLIDLNGESGGEEEIQAKFRKCLKHYQILKRYCSTVHNIISITMFVQFSMAAMIICVVLTGLTFPSTAPVTYMFMITYLVVIILEIFMPAWIGTYLAYESEKLAFAAYSGSWIGRSEGYKSTLKLFLQHSMVPINFTAWRMFPLSLNTFVSIIKTAYSFFTLIRNVQDREVIHN